jgi:hypothetical protein
MSGDQRGLPMRRPTLVLFLMLSFLNAALAAQVRPPRPTAVVSGVVTDTSGAPISLVDIRISVIGVAASTDASGRFRLAGVPLGTARLAIRRIGYRPLALEIQVTRPTQELDTLRLEPFPAFLPEVSVEGRLEPPSFFLRPEFAFGIGWMPKQYRPYGAAMVKYEVFSVIATRAGSEKFRHVSVKGYTGNFEGSRQVKDSMLCLDRIAAPVATSLDDTAGVVRMLNQDGRVWVNRLQGMYVEGDCFESMPLKLTEPILAASAAPNGWAVLSADSLGVVRIRLFNHFGRAVHATTLGSLFGREVAGPGVALAPGLRGVILTLTRSPFDWVEIDTTGKAVLLSGPFDRAGRRPALVDGGETAGWRSFGVLPVDRGYLQTLEKPDHSKRVLVLYDILGRPTRRPEPGTVPVCIASSIERRRLLCIRYRNPWGTLSRVAEYAY